MVKKMTNGNGNNVKMIRTDPDTIDILGKLKGWHFLRGNNSSYADIVKNLVFKDAKRKGLINKDLLQTQKEGDGR